MRKFSFVPILLLLLAVLVPTLAAQTPVPAKAAQPALTLLRASDYHAYVQQFARDEQEATGKTPADAWPWMETHIPLFSSSNKDFEEMYYFRWYAWQKHVVESRQGWLVTEWLPRPEAADGFFGALPDAAPFHLGEARWLRNSSIASDYARFWTLAEATPRKYSFPLAASVRSVVLATGDEKLGSDLLPKLAANYSAWEASNLDASVGLFWQIDTRDAMEKSIGGDGYRPVLSPYMAADARAIAEFARASRQEDIARQYDQKAATVENLIEEKLWNSKDQFYETLSPSADSGIRKQKRFKDPGTQLQPANVRELIGYIPWLYAAPASNHAVAWKQLFDPQGFAGAYGPTTAERRSPRFRFASSDQCTWNGPSWPFATTQTLLALSSLLNGSAQNYASRGDYYTLFAHYVKSQHLTLPSGRTIDWIDEDLDADTGEWIARKMLIAKNKQIGRGNYYNHSGFADPLITGLIGLRPQQGDVVKLNPLLPSGAWTYFALDGLPYHGHLLNIVFDPSGTHFKRGHGLMLFVDGKLAAQRKDLGPLQASLAPVK